MCSPLIVFVADPHRTQASCAVLGYLQQTERRRSGRSIQFVFNPTGTPAPGLLGGADGAVLVLLEAQKAAAEHLLDFWETVNKAQDRSVPVLPVVIRGNNMVDNNWHRSSSAVTVAEHDIVIEHGGQLSLTEAAETEIDQALDSVLRLSVSEHSSSRNACCPAA